MTIDPRFIEKARRLLFALGLSGTADDMQAIALALQDARDEENRACYQELERMARRYESPTEQDDNGYRVLLAAMDEVAARRGPG